MVVRRWNQLKSDEPDAFDDKLVRARDKRKHTAETAYPSLVFSHGAPLRHFNVLVILRFHSGTRLIGTGRSLRAGYDGTHLWARCPSND
jgi:hypothetical protein